MTTSNETLEQSNKGNFIRALIKMHHPEWSTAEIDEELKKRLDAIENPNNDKGCEMCSG